MFNYEVSIIINKVLNHCPVCNKELIITKLNCKHCQITIEGEFIANKFSRLQQEQLEFIETFLKSRGNIKDVEKELGISYPTVRNRLDSVLQTLGYCAEKSETSKNDLQRQEILSSLENGEITSEEAALELRKFKNRKSEKYE